MEHPIISVITPCYNQEKYLSEAVDSVLYQTFQNWEMVIVDDGSTDGSANTAKMYAAKDTRIHYVYQQNAGPSAARNKGVKNSQGQYLMFLDGDNKLDRTYLEKAVCHMDSHPDTVVFMTRAMHFGTRNDEFMIRWKGYNKLLLANTVDCGCVVRRIDFETVGGFDEKLRGGGRLGTLYKASFRRIPCIPTSRSTFLLSGNRRRTKRELHRHEAGGRTLYLHLPKA